MVWLGMGWGAAHHASTQLGEELGLAVAVAQLAVLPAPEVEVPESPPPSRKTTIGVLPHRTVLHTDLRGGGDISTSKKRPVFSKPISHV